MAALPAAPGPRGGGGSQEEEASLERVQQETLGQRRDQQGGGEPMDCQETVSGLWLILVLLSEYDN